MVQVLAVEVVVVLIVVEVKANGASASACFVYIVSVHIVLLGILIPAFGEILVRADGAKICQTVGNETELVFS